jgi:hypothetical protein
MDDPPLVASAGKTDLGGGKLTGITGKLLNTRLGFAAKKVWVSTGSVTTGDTNGRVLTDSGATFQADGVQPGNWIVNLTDGSLCTVLTVDTEQQITTDVLGGGTDNQFDVSDSYKILAVDQHEVLDGNLAAVDDVGAPLDPILPTAGTQVVRTSDVSAALIPGSSATAVEIADAVWDEAASDHLIAGSTGLRAALILHDHAIWIDTNNGNPGTVIGTNGTGDNPVDSLADALALVGSTGFRHLIVVQGNLVLTASLNEFLVELRDESELNLNGQNVNGSEFRGGRIKGAMSGIIMVVNAEVEDVSGFIGTMVNCGVTGDLTLAAGRTTLAHCYSKVPGTNTPTIDFNAVASELSMRGYSGGIALRNMGHAANLSTCEFIAGQIIIEATCTDGVLVVRGLVAPITNNSTGTTVIKVGGEIAEQVDEVHTLHALVKANPLSVSPTQRQAGGITQDIVTAGSTTTVTRQ